jgi:lysophospholipase L1-like esterase
MIIRKPRKNNLFFNIMICLISLELVLQIASLPLKIKKLVLVRSGGDFNILCIGDSFTYGTGAPLQDSYPKQLERILDKDFASKHINAINLGIPGSNSSQCLKYLKEKFDFYKPEIVIVLVGMNNCWNFNDSSYFEIKQFKYNNPLKYRIMFIDALLSKSRTYRLIKITFLNITARLKPASSAYKNSSSLNKEFPMPKRSNELIELLNQGLRYYEEDKCELSEVYYRRALELAPDDYEPHWNIGRFYNMKGQTEKGREELILAAKYAFHPYTVSCILADLHDRSQSKDSKDFKEFTALIKGLRSYWVEKFGEAYVQRFIDPAISYEESDLEKILVYDLEKMANYTREKQARLIILTYPVVATRFGYREEIYYRISSYLCTPLIDNVSLFNKYPKIYRYEELFSRDGHCTEKGYKLMAENIAATLKKHKLLP